MMDPNVIVEIEDAVKRALSARPRMGRLGNGKTPASIIGALTDILVREAQP